MSFGRDKYQSRMNCARVREILMREWDPIGVAGIEEAADEYDSYGAEAYVMLMDAHASAETIAAYLFKVATEHMGLSNRAHLAESCDRAATSLVALRPEFEAQ